MRVWPDARSAARMAGAFILLCAALVAEDAHADLVPCREMKKHGSKILLDDLEGSGVDEVDMGSLRYALDGNLAQIQLESDHKAVRCPNRIPKGPSDYDRSTVQALNDYSVTLEVWAKVSSKVDSTGHRLAMVGYVLVPVHHHHPAMPGVVLIPYKMKETITVERLLAMLDQSGRLAAYASIATGVRLMKALKYDEARKHLCASQASLMSLPVQGSPKDALLLEYVAGLAEEVVRQARDAPGYLGALRLTEGAACPLNVQ